MNLELEPVPSVRPTTPIWIVISTLAVIPFFITIRNVEIINGGIVSYRDYVAILAGITALLVATYVGFVTPRRGGPAMFAVAVGMLHLMRGLGIL